MPTAEPFDMPVDVPARREADEAPGEYGSADSPILPTGGGSAKSLDGAYKTNSSNGTGSYSLPFELSAGRGGFGPSLSLEYDAGSGNGPFGLGFQVATPSIRRKTSKGIPKYDDSDVFTLSGAEDLVPLVDDDGDHTAESRDFDGRTYTVKKYLPRTEGLFSTIERWILNGDEHWRIVDGDNKVSIFGLDSRSRVLDRGNTRNIAEWRIHESYDDMGNAVRFHYKRENESGVTTSLINEVNRTADTRSTALYVKRIQYGNSIPRDRSRLSQDNEYHFEVVFDYGEHGEDSRDEIRPWLVRNDPFSTCVAGFEVRYYRLCQRVLMFHHFPDEQVGSHALVRSWSLIYRHREGVEDDRQLGEPLGAVLHRISAHGYDIESLEQVEQDLPPIELGYTSNSLSLAVETAPGEIENRLPELLAEVEVTVTDIDSIGTRGVLRRESEDWSYHPNTSARLLGISRAQSTFELGPRETIRQVPGHEESTPLGDIERDGTLDLLALEDHFPGFRERGVGGGWERKRMIERIPNIPLADPSGRRVDLNGDGWPDWVSLEDEDLEWYALKGSPGFDAARRTRLPRNALKEIRSSWLTARKSVQFADMTGDGLVDLVCVSCKRISYWQNLGYGQFSDATVTMRNAPTLSPSDTFDPSRVLLGDLDGTGTTDLIYMGGEGAVVYRNESGNAWAERQIIPEARSSLPGSAQLLDLFGNGTLCLVWAIGEASGRSAIRLVDFSDRQKSNLLNSIDTNTGRETHITYAPSTKFAVDDRLMGNPWVTRLHFPVHVVERVESIDRITRSRFSTRYAYHDGHFDGVDREARGFGMVDVWDSEFYGSDGGEFFPEGENESAILRSPAVLTRTWYHTGHSDPDGRVSEKRSREHFSYRSASGGTINDLELHNVFPDDLTPEERRQAHRALRGSVLRQETYELTAEGTSSNPMLVIQRSFSLKLVQKLFQSTKNAVFYKHESEDLTLHTERNVTDPRASHKLVLAVDDFGNELRSASVTYGRLGADERLPARLQEQQRKTSIVIIENDWTEPIVSEDGRRNPMSASARTYELTTSENPNLDAPLTNEALNNAFVAAVERSWMSSTASGLTEKRLLSEQRTRYRADNLESVLPGGHAGLLGIHHQTYTLAFEESDLDELFNSNVGSALAQSAGQYTKLPGSNGYWIPSGTAFFSKEPGDTPAEELAKARQHFFTVTRRRSPFTSDDGPVDALIYYDPYDLSIELYVDGAGNMTSVGIRDAVDAETIIEKGFNYRHMVPLTIMDENRNVSRAAVDAIGQVVGLAQQGKPGDGDGDSLEGFRRNLSDAQMIDVWTTPDASARALLAKATSRMIRDAHAYRRAKAVGDIRPVAVLTTERITHDSELSAGEESEIVNNFEYLDGEGRRIQVKVRGADGPLPSRDASGQIAVNDSGHQLFEVAEGSRWVANGIVLLDNKGNEIAQWDNYYTDTHHWETGAPVGKPDFLFYDGVGRQVGALGEDMTWEKLEIEPWVHTRWDENDTLMMNPGEDETVGSHFNSLPEDIRNQRSWYDRRIDGSSGVLARRAALISEVHADTPSIDWLNPAGQVIASGAINRTVDTSGSVSEELLITEMLVDVKGQQLSVIDPSGRIVAEYHYDVSGRRTKEQSMEAGGGVTFADIASKPVYQWDERNHRTRRVYDRLQRPKEIYLRKADPDLAVGDSDLGESEVLIQRDEYGEEMPNAISLNRAGKLARRFDACGLVENERFDFKGNLAKSNRRLAVAYKGINDWSDDVSLQDEELIAETWFDAQDRTVRQRLPDRTEVANEFDEGGKLFAVRVRERGASDPTGNPIWSNAVTGITYNAMGQRTKVRYGNDVETLYQYYENSERLRRVYSKRGAAFDRDCGADASFASPEFPPDDAPCGVQNTRYTYDAVGNITNIEDLSQQRVFYRNSVVEAGNTYRYDALYRLVEASGREQLGLTARNTSSHRGSDIVRLGVAHPADGQALVRYTETYTYDRGNNLIRIRHRRSGGIAGWTIDFAFSEASNIRPTDRSNRMSSVSSSSSSSVFHYDSHGNITAVPHLALIEWNYANQLSKTRRQMVASSTAEPGGTTYYQFDADGRRVRKTTEKPDGSVLRQTTYLGVLERHRRTGSTELRFDSIHVQEGGRPVAELTSRLSEDGIVLDGQWRYKLQNQVGSVSLELDADAELITHEEYNPWGVTSHKSTGASIGIPKRYRYAGKEKDEESGFYYFGARYYIPWLHRWASSDPNGPSAGLNAYEYASSNPIVNVDVDGNDSIFSDYLEGVGRAVVGVVTLGGSVDDISDAFSSNGGGLTGTLAAIDRANPLGRARETATDAFDSHGGGLEGSLAAADSLNPFARVRDTAVEGYERGGGGLEGTLTAVDDLNPFARVRDSGAATIDAIQRGDARGAGEAFTNTLLGAAALAAPFARAAGAGATATRSSPPSSRTPRATSTPRSPAPEAPRAPPPEPPPPPRPPQQRPRRRRRRRPLATAGEVMNHLERHVRAQNNRVARAVRRGDRHFFRRLDMTEGAIDRMMNPSGSRFAREYGNALERAVGRAITRDPQLRGMVADVHRAGQQNFPTVRPGRRGHLRPDFEFRSGPLEGQIIDLTTPGQYSTKLAKYHDRVIVLTYDRPTFP